MLFSGFLTAQGENSGLSCHLNIASVFLLFPFTILQGIFKFPSDNCNLFVDDFHPFVNSEENDVGILVQPCPSFCFTVYGFIASN